MDFVGKEAKDDSDSQLKHYIAVVDPTEKTWQFVEVRKVTLRGAVRQAKQDEDESSDEEEKETLRAQKTELTNTFGTKQSKKMAQSMAENAQLSNAPSGHANAAETALLSSMPGTASGEATDLATKAASVQAQVQAAKPLPKANLAATHPADVYSIDTLVPNGHSTLRQLPGVNEWAETVNAGQPVTTTSRYVSRRVEAVVKSGNTTQLQLLRFIFLLLEFARSLRNGGPSSGPGGKRLPTREDLRRILSSANGSSSSGPGTNTNTNSSGETLPDPVIDSIRRQFAPNGGHMSKNDLTLLHTTICALTLHIPPQPSKDASGFGGNGPSELATDPSDLRDDLRLDNPTVTQYFRELGCRVDKPRETEFAKWGVKGGKAEAAARRVARLRVPVEFPRVSRGGKR